MRRNVVALLALILLWAGTAPAADLLDQQIGQLNQQIASLRQRCDQERAANQKRRDSADMKLAYATAEKLDRWNAELSRLETERDRLCDQWRAQYPAAVDRLLDQLGREKDRQKRRRIADSLLELQERKNRLCPQNQPAAVSSQWQSLKLEPYDGPEEIRQKAELLKDLSRELSINLARLDSQYQDAMREQMTRERVQEFVQEETLFNESFSVRQQEGRLSAYQGHPEPAVTGSYAPERTGDQNNTSSPQQEPQLSVNTTNWRGESPDRIESDYRKLRADLMKQQELIRRKIQEFEEKGRALLP